MPVSKKTSLESGPRYVWLAEHFTKQIRRGQLRPGDRLPTFKEMRAEFGVTPTTVERVHVELEKQGLIEREARRGVFVSGVRPSTGCGVIGHHISGEVQKHPYFIRLLQGVEQATCEAGHELLILRKSSVVKWEKVDGLLLFGSFPEPILKMLPPGMPVVSMLFPIPNMASVNIDEHEGMRIATNHLISLGHRRIAYLHSIGPYALSRLEGYRDALRKRKIKVDPRLQFDLPSPDYSRGVPYPEYYREAGGQTIEYWFEKDWHELGITAIVAYNDDVAIGVIEALQKKGIQVPQDVSVIGFDGTEVSTYCRPQLTTVEVPLFEVGARATEILLEKIRQPLDKLTPDAKKFAKESVEILPVKLRVRQSCAEPPR